MRLGPAPVRWEGWWSSASGFWSKCLITPSFPQKAACLLKSWNNLFPLLSSSTHWPHAQGIWNLQIRARVSFRPRGGEPVKWQSIKQTSLNPPGVGAGCPESTIMGHEGVFCDRRRHSRTLHTLLESRGDLLYIPLLSMVKISEHPLGVRHWYCARSQGERWMGHHCVFIELTSSWGKTIHIT